MKKKLIILGVIILGISLLITLSILKAKNIGVFSDGKKLEVKMVDAKIEDIDAEVSVNGVVEEVDSEEIYFDAQVKVKDVYVEKDDTVTVGQKLLDFDMDDMTSQLEQARINLNIQEITLSKIVDSFKQQNITQVENAVSQAETAMLNAKTNLDRIQKLYDEGAASLLEYENAKTGFQSASLQYNTAQSNLDELKKNNVDLSSNNQKDIASQQEQIKLTQIRINDLENKINKLNQQSISKINGVISELNVQKGSYTNPSMMGIKMINPDFLQVKLEVKEVDIQKVKQGQKVKITGDAFSGKTMEGYVKSISLLAQKKQGMNTSDEAFVNVTVSVDNTEKVLRPGLSVNANIITDTRKSAVVIPFNTFQEDKDGNKWVFAIENGVSKQKNIKIGISSNLLIEVVSGLNGKEKLVEDPPSRLKDNMKVTIK